jgi:hypothetical protein
MKKTKEGQPTSNIIGIAKKTIEFGQQPHTREEIRNEDNRQKGRQGERDAELWAMRNGLCLERTGKGSDYKVLKIDPFTGRKTFLFYLEVKSSESALVTKLQKECEKRYGPRFWKKAVFTPAFY